MDDMWNEGLFHLIHFVKEEGHARVPDAFKTEDGFKLGFWVANKRKAMKANELTSEQIEKLQALEGWIWAKENS